jgi:hypothetical protein
VKVGKPDTLSGHLVDARRLDPAIVKAHIATTQIIGKDVDDVRTLAGLCRPSLMRHGQQQAASAYPYRLEKLLSVHIARKLLSR